MIEALFNQPNYVAAKKALDAIELRHEAIASNIANVETPGYKRLDISTSFKSELDRAIASKSPQQIAALQPEITIDSSAVALSPDGNTVNLEDEMLQLSQNSIAHTLETHLISGALMKLRLAITGKPS